MTTTTIHLSEAEIAEMMRLTRQPIAGDAITAAAREFLRHAQRMELKNLSGRVRMEDNWRDLEADEMRG